MSIILDFYNIQPNDGGSMVDWSKEYYSLVSHELISILLGCLADYERWQLIDEIRELPIRVSQGKKWFIGRQIYYWPELTNRYYNHMTGQNYTIPPSVFIRQRFADSEEILSIYISGSLLMMLMAAKREEFFYPFIIGILLLSSGQSFVPNYITKLKRKTFAVSFMKALGIVDIVTLRDLLDKLRTNDFGTGISYHHSTLEAIFADEGIGSKDDIGSS